MRTSFSGIEISRRALQTQQMGLDVAGHNIANANTPGYSRQMAAIRAASPHSVPTMMRPTTAGQVGTGSTVAEIRRIRDAFIDLELNSEVRTKGQWDARQETMSQVELIFLEPSDQGIREELDQFWVAMQELSEDPDNQATRRVVRHRAIALTTSLEHLDNQLRDLTEHVDRSIYGTVQQVNGLLEEMGSLNRQIGEAVGVGDNPNDLFDRRNLVMQELARLAGASFVGEDREMVKVTIDGKSVVSGINVTKMDVSAEVPSRPTARVTIAGSDEQVDFRGGRLLGLFESRDDVVGRYREELDELARTLAQEMNALHREGYGLTDDPQAAPPGRDFFTVKDTNEPFRASNIRLNQDIDTDPNLIAASLSGAPGDGGNAIRMAQLKHDRIMRDGTATMWDFYVEMVTGIGVDAANTNKIVEAQEILVGHLERKQDSISGVSLDEEMADLIKFQHAYQAAARVMNSMDEALETIIQRLGLVGR